METSRRFIAFALALLLHALPAFAQSLSIQAPEVLSETRVSRTVFKYVMQASVQNNGATMARGVTATCTSTSPKTTVVDGTLSIGNVAPGAATASTDTFTITHDRTVPFDPAVWQWTFTKVPAAPAVTAPASPTTQCHRAQRPRTGEHYPRRASAIAFHRLPS